MPLLTPPWILGFVFAWCFFASGKLEVKKRGGRNPGLLWALASIGVTAAVIQGLNGGAFLVVLAQVALFAAIAFWRVSFEK